jgi:hypothetical protein
MGEAVRWRASAVGGNALLEASGVRVSRLVRAASPLLPKGEASAKGEATAVMGH